VVARRRGSWRREVIVGLLSKCLSTLWVWLSNEVLPGGDLAVVWLERGTSTASICK
jgi:hypothetical protein